MLEVCKYSTFGMYLKILIVYYHLIHFCFLLSILFGIDHEVLFSVCTFVAPNHVHVYTLILHLIPDVFFIFGMYCILVPLLTE